MPYRASWHVSKNPPRSRVYKLRETAEKYGEHLSKTFGKKLLYFNIEEV